MKPVCPLCRTTAFAPGSLSAPDIVKHPVRGCVLDGVERPEKDWKEKKNG